MQARTLALQSLPPSVLTSSVRIMIELPKIILASASPRRAEILRTVGWPFETLAVDIDESRREGEDADDYVQRLALEKAEAAAAIAARAGAVSSPSVRSRFVIGADTTV